MEITFQTKQESKRKQQLAFLKLTSIKRFYRFLDLMVVSKQLPTKLIAKKESNNFVVQINATISAK